ncbi:MAG: pyridoxamine 5'-phosphate oxidase [Chloroflexota bacterium]
MERISFAEHFDDEQGNSMAKEPITRFKELLAQAEQLGTSPHNAAALATAGNDLEPTVRMVLLKGVDDRGFVFYTNLESRKARQLADNRRASLCFWWPQLKRQVRVEGVAELVNDQEADEYFASRPRGSQIAAWASRQSRELASRQELLGMVADLTARYEDQPVPRPPHWSGYRLVPERIEFWKEQPDRLHEREVYTRQPSGWKITLLAP